MSFNKVDENGKKRYKWMRQTSDYINPSAEKWVVLLGIDASAFNADTNAVQIKDSSGTVIDSFKLKGFGVAANEELVGLIRRMVCPPSGSIVVTVGANVMSLVECASLEDALAIL